tara:strand:- start:257 stop:430 length:174 start_codon:yes stop_codon:yes gene_type:complete
MKYLMILILLFSQGCTGLLVYELISSSQVIEDDTENVPMVNVKYYYDKPDKKTTGKE